MRNAILLFVLIMVMGTISILIQASSKGMLEARLSLAYQCGKNDGLKEALKTTSGITRTPHPACTEFERFREEK